MNLNELLHFRPGRTKPVPLQRRALGLLAGFFVFMAVCTVISRAADSLTVARVTAEKPTRAPIVHTVEADGILEANGETPVTTLENARIQSVAVREGASVKAGDLLFTLDMDYLTRMLTEKQLEWQRARLLVREQQRKDAQDREKDSLTEARAGEDLEIAMKRADQKIRQAGEDRRRARQELRDYRNDNTVDDEADDSDLDPAYIALRDNYREKQRLYDEALTDQEEAALRAERAVEDLRFQEENRQAELLSIDLRLKQLELSRVQEAVNAGGEVTAPVDAVVSALTVGAGRMTTGEAALMLTEQKDGLRFVAEVDSDARKYLSRGDEVELELEEGRERASCTIESLRALADRDGWYQAVCVLPEGKGTLGAAAKMTAKRRTEPYSTCVPAGALRSDGGQDYVLILRESETSLGTELTAERVDVAVSDHNETRAAVSGALDNDSRVIVGSDRPVGTGDRVRREAE